MSRNLILIVLDSVGIGDAPDSIQFETEGSNTLAHVAGYNDGLDVPTMQRLGLGNIRSLLGVQPASEPDGNYGRMCEMSNSVDSTSGHWEMMGVTVEEPFPIYPEGFPDEVIEPFKERIGSDVLGNKPESGTVIIEQLGEEHLRTGNPIVYTSADSVFQIAAHEDVISVDELYEICREARDLLDEDHPVGRVIARPFVGSPGSFERTHRRKDYTIEPTGRTVLEDLSENDIEVKSVGKINQIFSGIGISDAYKTEDNEESITKTIDLIETNRSDQFVFTNLVDFDMKYGHRNDPEGYASALEHWDQGLKQILGSMDGSDLLMISADHGTDPTTPSTDHSREMVPLLVYGPSFREGIDLGVRLGFSDVGQTILDLFDLPKRLNARSFLPEINHS